MISRKDPAGMVLHSWHQYRGECQLCKEKKEDLSYYKGKYLCRACLCPDYDGSGEVMRSLSRQTTSRKWEF